MPRLRHPAIPDVAFIDLEYPSGAIAHVELSWLAPSKLRRTTIVGSQKMVVYDDTSTSRCASSTPACRRGPRDFGEYRLTYRTGDIVSPVSTRSSRSTWSCDFCEAVRTGPSPLGRPVGLDVVATIEAAHRSLTGGGGPRPRAGATCPAQAQGALR